MEDNIILIDWVSMTFKQYSPMAIKRLLGMEELPWQPTTGARGYQRREYFGGISIHFEPCEEQEYKVWLEMSGQGCRTFETYGSCTFAQLLALAHYEEGVHITRIDVAFDDHTRLINIDEVARKIREKEFTALASWWKVEISSEGTSCYVGSPRSDLRIRIYDKAAERGKEGHWVRIELQMRDDHALGFTKQKTSLGETFRGVLRKYLVFREPNLNDTHKYRWDISPWFEELLAGIGAISLLSNPGTDYNLFDCESYVFHQAGNAIETIIQVYGLETFIDKLFNRPPSLHPNPKYQRLIDEHLGISREDT